MVNEIAFMEHFEKNLLGKNKANFDTIRDAANLIGFKADINCPACARNAYLELLNIYNRMLIPYEKYKAEQLEKPVGPIYTKYEDEEINTQEGEYKPLVEPELVRPIPKKLKTK